MKIKSIKILTLFAIILFGSFSCKNSDTTLTLPLPERGDNAPVGSQFIKEIDTMLFAQREELIVKEILSGNIPDFLRSFRKISYTGASATGQNHKVEFYALPDYLSIGSNGDFVRIPMGPLAAQQIADSLNCSLPTALLVDKIAEAADGAIEPFPFRPLGYRNCEPVTFEDSNNAINALFKAKGYKPGELISGLKKDVIITSKIEGDTSRRNHVTIYGWHYPDGKRIQPSNNVHVNYYVDYSHGIRLIYRIIKIDGAEYDIQQVLKDSSLFSLVSDEPTPMLRPTYKGDTLHQMPSATIASYSHGANPYR